MIAVTGTDAILLLQVLVCRRHATEHYCFNHQSLDLYCANSAHDAINAAGSNPAPSAAFDVTITLIVAAAAAAAAVATKTVAAKYCRLVVPRCC